MPDSQNRTRNRVTVDDPAAIMAGSHPKTMQGSVMSYTSTAPEGGRWQAQFTWDLRSKTGYPIGLTLTSLDGQPISSAQLRAVPIGDLRQADSTTITRIMVQTARNIEKLTDVLGYNPWDTNHGPATTAKSAVKRRPRKLQSRRNPKEVEMVAMLWQQYQQQGVKNVSQAIAADLHMAASTVRKRIMECRQAGLIAQIPSQRQRTRRRAKKRGK